jgi:hypothetical protein
MNKYLDKLHVIYSFEAGVKKSDLLDDKTIYPIRAVDVDSVADVIWMFDE